MQSRMISPDRLLDFDMPVDLKAADRLACYDKAAPPASADSEQPRKGRRVSKVNSTTGLQRKRARGCKVKEYLSRLLGSVQVLPSLARLNRTMATARYPGGARAHSVARRRPAPSATTTTTRPLIGEVAGDTEMKTTLALALVFGIVLVGFCRI